jgi:hypothetical protein
MKLCALLFVTLASCAWAADLPRNHRLSWATLHGDPQGSGRSAFKIILTFVTFFFIDSAESRNIVALFSDRRFTANPVRLTDTDVGELFFRTPDLPTRATFLEGGRIAAKLEAHIIAFLDGAALMKHLPAQQLSAFIDVPWSKGDFYFIERCVLALRADAGRPWKKL